MGLRSGFAAASVLGVVTESGTLAWYGAIGALVALATALFVERGRDASLRGEVVAWSAFLLLAILVALDMQNLASRFGRVLPIDRRLPDSDFTFVIPIFGDPKYFRNGEYLSVYRENTLLAVNVDSEKMERFVVELRAARGWRVHVARLPGRVSCPELVLDALRSVTTSYVMRHRGVGAPRPRDRGSQGRQC